MNPLDLYTLDQKSFSFLDLIGQVKVETWTPTDRSGAGLTFTTAIGNYIKIGPLVFAFGEVVYPVTADGSNAAIDGLPFTASNTLAASQGNVSYGDPPVQMRVSAASNFILLFSTVTGAQVTNATVSGKTFIFQIIYF